MIRSMTRAEAPGLIPPSLQMQVSEMSSESRIIELAARIQRTWQENARAKEPIEQELLQCLRDRKGVYAPDELYLIEQQGGSDIFMKLPTTKIRACAAHITTVLMPEGDMAFSLKPTPQPTLAPWASQAIMQRVLQEGPRIDGQGKPVDPVEQSRQLETMIREEMDRMSKEAADRHDKKIMDQLVEGGWNEALTSFIDDFSTFPAAIMEGPVFENKPQRKWSRQPDGSWNVETTIEPKMIFDTISPFDCYPGPSAETPQDGDLIIRRRFRRKEIWNMKGMEGFSDQAIDDVLIEYGRSGLRDWLWTDSQREHLENKEYFWMRGASDEIDGIHFYGRAQGIELLEWGMSPDLISEPLADYEIEAIKIGRHVIKAVINSDPMFRRPIMRACYEQVPGSFWGNAVPFLMRDITRMCNGVARQLQNNMAHSSGLQIEVNYDRLSPETDPFDIYPNKIWQTRSSEFTSSSRAVEFFQPTSNAGELLSVYNEFLPQADDATGIPRFAHGNEQVGGAGDTARGLAMLMDSSARLLRKSIGNIDMGLIKPVIEMIYDHNMRYSDDNSIKGDLQVVAKGANALLQRESMREIHRLALDSTANELDMGIIGVDGRADLLRDYFNTMPTVRDGIVPSAEEIMQRQQEQQQSQPNPEMLKLQSEQEIAQAKMALEEQISAKKLAADVKRDEDKLRAEERRHSMRLESDREIESARLDAQLQRDRQTSDVALRREQMIQNAKMQSLQLELKQRATEAVQQREAERQARGQEVSREGDVKQAVIMEVGRMIEQLQSVTDGRMGAIEKLIESTTRDLDKQRTEAGGSMGSIVVNVDASCQKSGAKKVDLVKTSEGKMTATVVEGD